MKNVRYANGKWEISAKAQESGNYEYHDGDWYPKTKKKQEPVPKQRKIKKMNCGAFPLGKIKEFCRVATLYILSGALGISLALNVFWYMEKRYLENQNLQLKETLEKLN